MTDKKTYYIAVDGGATKTAFLLSDGDRILRELRLGPCNPVDVGLDAMNRTLVEGTDALLAGEISRESCFLFAGISGILTGDCRERTRDFLNRLGLAAADCASDADNIIAAGLRGKDGIAGIMGTGSVLFAVKDGNSRRFGGYGNFFDTSLSGYTLGCETIKAVLAFEEGSGEETDLRGKLLKQIGKETALQNLAAYYEGGKQYIAAFAPLTLEAAAEGDRVALGILRRAAEDTARLLRAAQSHIGAPCPAVFTGGLAEGAGEILFPMIREALGDTPVTLSVLEEAPVKGALLRAMALNPKAEKEG